jgi:branched-chain amino acid transport system substrate-binding protein
MPIRKHFKRGLVAACCALLVALSPLSSRAADPYEIYVIEALTGPATFAGSAQAAAIAALEPVVNRTGGINGRPIKFVVKDDESNPQVALQLINEIEANAKVPFILGPSDVASCNAAFPLVAKAGPVLYCMSGAATPIPNSYGFTADVASSDLVVAGIRYFRLRGMTRVALVTTNEANGQLYDKAVDATLQLPENKDVQLVAHEHYNPNDLNANAQIARVKAANAQVLILGVAGTPTGTALRAISDLGLKIPVATGNGNASYVQMAQYEKFLPSKWYFFSFLCLLPDEVGDKQIRGALQTYATALRAAGVRPDGLQSSSWDPALMMVGALRKLGTNATPAQLRDYIAGLRGFVGANGRYDFLKTPLRGLDDSQAIIGLWDDGKQRWVAASKPGGVPLPGR